jgi:hypothetical protein
MTFTPPQAWRSCTGRIEEIEPGWQPFPDELVDNLRSFDLPPPAGTAAAEDQAEPAWLVMAAVALAAGGTLVMARRRSSRAQAVRAT